MPHSRYRRKTGMEPREKFEIFCKRQGWQFDCRSRHESFVNSKKLKSFEIFEPSYQVDKDFNDLSVGIIFVEVKACNAKGFVKVQRQEWEIHRQLGQARPVYYALYDSRISTIDDAFTLVDIEEIAAKEVLEEADDYFVLNIQDLGLS